MIHVPKDWPNIVRIAWLGGGAVAVSNPGDSTVKVGIGLNGPTLTDLKLTAFDSLYSTLKLARMNVIGATFIKNKEEASGLVPAEFRALSAIGGWRVCDGTQQWRQIAYSASMRDQMDLFDIASRIASGLRYSEIRLNQLAAAYSQQLRGRASTGLPADFIRFQDLNSFPVYMAIHAMFWELAVLRDALAEFAARYALSFDKITSMGGLVKRMLKETRITPLYDELIRAANEESNGWIAIFTAYRNLFTHVVPMEQAAGVACAISDYQQFNSELRLPCIYYPLPSDATGVMLQRLKGQQYPTLEAFILASSGKKPERAEQPDALDYLACVLDQMGDLAMRLLTHSPIAPKAIELTAADLLGPIAIRRAD